MEIADIIDLERYPLHEPADPAYKGAVAAARAELQETGCTVVKNFVRPAAIARMAEESAAHRPAAWLSSGLYSPYPPHQPSDDARWPTGHPRRAGFTRASRFVAYDTLADSTVRALYDSSLLTDFIRECVALPELHHSGDPLAACNLSIQEQGDEVPWHFDFSPFVVTLLIRAPQEGGRFQYIPNIRSAGDEKYESVAGILNGGQEGIVDLELEVGDLQLFEGRYTLHRVTSPSGSRWRCIALFCYRERPNVIGTDGFQMEHFGRVLREGGAVSG